MGPEVGESDFLGHGGILGIRLGIILHGVGTIPGMTLGTHRGTILGIILGMARGMGIILRCMCLVITGIILLIQEIAEQVR